MRNSPPKSLEEIQPSDDNKYMMNYIGSELSEIRDVLHILLNNVRLEHAADLPEVVQGIYKSFIENDLEPDIAYDLARAMEDCFNSNDGPSIHKHLSILIGRLIKVSGEINLPVREATDYEGMGQIPSAAAVVALIGPTGVGKTTTIAKIAEADFVFDHRTGCIFRHRTGGTGTHCQLPAERI